MRIVCGVIVLALVPVLATCAAPPPEQQAAQLAQQIRQLILEFLPDPLYEDTKNWNKQKQGRGGKVRNEGRWLKYRITPHNLPATLQLNVANLQKLDKTRSTFTVNLEFLSYIHLERQTWKMGLRLYSGSTRARCKLQLSMNCELTNKIETGKGFIPDMIVRLRVLNAAFSMDDIVVEHTAGVGGDAAKLLGEMMIGIVKAAKPSLERKLIEKANAAIVKAGDTKEIRISLSDWLSGKKPGGASKPTPPPKK